MFSKHLQELDKDLNGLLHRRLQNGILVDLMNVQNIPFHSYGKNISIGQN